MIYGHGRAVTSLKRLKLHLKNAPLPVSCQVGKAEKKLLKDPVIPVALPGHFTENESTKGKAHSTLGDLEGFTPGSPFTPVFRGIKHHLG